jgi:hypothetical protein
MAVNGYLYVGLSRPSDAVVADPTVNRGYLQFITGQPVLAVGTATGTISAIGQLAGDATGQSSGIGIALCGYLYPGEANPNDGRLRNPRELWTAATIGTLAGAATGSSTVVGTIQANGALAGTATGTSTVVGTITGTGALAGAATGTSTVVGTVTGTGALAGAATGQSVVTGAIVGTGALEGHATGTSTVVGAITDAGGAVTIGVLEGHATGQIIVTGDLDGVVLSSVRIPIGMPVPGDRKIALSSQINGSMEIVMPNAVPKKIDIGKWGKSIVRRAA